MTEQSATCPDCGHEHHGTGMECEHGIQHGTSRWHRCLCLARPGADRECPPLMDCQGGLLGYADIWHLQQGHNIQGPAGALITPDVLTAEQPVRHTVDTITDDDLDQLYARAEKAERAANLLAGAHRRAEQAEAERDQLRADLGHQAQELATWRVTVATLDSGAPGTPRHRAERAEAALARVRALHRAAHYGGRIICAECSAYDGHTSTDSPPVDHPCSTVAALDEPKEPRP